MGFEESQQNVSHGRVQHPTKLGLSSHYCCWLIDLHLTGDCKKHCNELPVFRHCKELPATGIYPGFTHSPPVWELGQCPSAAQVAHGARRSLETKIESRCAEHVLRSMGPREFSTFQFPSVWYMLVHDHAVDKFRNSEMELTAFERN